LQITFSLQNDNSVSTPKHQVDFGAGLTPSIMQEIHQADILEISNRLAKKGIRTDFKGNKVIAWCSNKTVEIFEQLNKKFGMHLALPDGIYVEDFSKLDIPKNSLASFCNLVPSNLRKNSTDSVPAKTLFFNTFETVAQGANPNTKWIYDWGNINEIADKNYLIRHSSTDHFLGTFIQEASHNAHLVRASKNIGGNSLKDRIKLFEDEQIVKEYQQKYGKKLAQISTNALKNPFEAVASDMSKIIAESLDPKTLNITKNPFIGTPYENLSFWQRVNIPNYSDEERPLNEILRHFWNGKFD
jgi:hypothetical protein